MKLAKYLFVILFVMFIGISTVNADTLVVTLPNGQTVPLDGLSEDEKKYMITYINKIAEAQVKQTQVENIASTKNIGILKDTVTDPQKLKEYGLMITDIIKTICNDLSITVNDFIKTPVGLGVAALIGYQVFGKDLLPIAHEVFTDTMQTIVIIPIWIGLMAVLFYLRKKYFGTIVIYNKKKEIPNVDENKKPTIEYSDPELKTSYPWDSNDARNGGSVVLHGCMIVISIISIMIIFI